MDKDKKEKNKRALNLAFVILLATASILFAFGAVLFFCYGVASAVAFNGSMIALVIFACCFMCLGFALGIGHSFLIYRKKYCITYLNAPEQSKKELERKSKTESKQVTTLGVIKDMLTLSNASLVFLLVGVVLAVSSAALGSTSNEKWVQASSKLKEENGYYESASLNQVSYVYQRDIVGVQVELCDKNAVVIFRSGITEVKVEGYCLYPDEITFLNIDGDGILHLSQNPSPRKKEALDNMFGFVFKPDKVEQQIRIYVPEDLKDTLSISGDYITANN